jgi:Bacterial pre-peptidase C-terminal domain
MMTNRRFMQSVMLIAFLATLGASRVALAVDEVETDDPLTFNDPVAKAQPLVIGSDGTVVVNGKIKNTTTHRDVDFYSFQAQEGDQVTFNIDGGMSADFTGVWTVLAVFGPNGTNHLPLRQSNFGDPVDAGSATPYDARIDNPPFLVPQTGTYVVGVSTEPGEFVNDDTLTSGEIYGYSPDYGVDGTYTLLISGVTPPAPPAPPAPPVSPVQQISIDIRPGHRDVILAYRDFNRGNDSERRHRFEALRGRFKGGLPVALLSSDTFNALEVDQSSLKFGATGNENSLMRCNRHGVDVNRDGRPDLICHFDLSKANFEVGDNEGIVTGTTSAGDFEGAGFLKILTGKRHHDQDHKRHHH